MHHRRRPAVSEHLAQELPGRSAGRETIQMGLWRSWWRNRGDSREHGKMRIIS